MSGIYISGMEMPKNCYGCPFFKQVDYWNKDEEADILSKCKRTGEFTWESVNGYLPNCPLIPVPPHGDLIDKKTVSDNLASVLNKKNPPFSYPDWNDAIVAMLTAPTIIPAEEGEG